MRISVITVTYNSGRTLESCINSVLNQTYNNIEYIIIDGGSEDDTLKVVEDYKERIAHFVSEPDNGIYDAINKGIKLATGDIVGILNSDDFYADKYVIEKVVRKFKEGETNSLYGDLLYVNAINVRKRIRYWKAGTFKYYKLKLGWMPPHPTFFVRREIYQKYGLYDVRYKISADYDLILRFLGKYKISVSYLPEVLVKMRVGGKSNRSIENIIKKSTEDYQIIKSNKIGGFYTLLGKNFSKLPQFLKVGRNV